MRSLHQTLANEPPCHTKQSSLASSRMVPWRPTKVTTTKSQRLCSTRSPRHPEQGPMPRRPAQVTTTKLTAPTDRAIPSQVQPCQQPHDALLLPVQPRVLHGHRQVVHGDLAIVVGIDEVEDLRRVVEQIGWCESIYRIHQIGACRSVHRGDLSAPMKWRIGSGWGQCGVRQARVEVAAGVYWALRHHLGPRHSLCTIYPSASLASIVCTDRGRRCSTWHHRSPTSSQPYLAQPANLLIAEVVRGDGHEQALDAVLVRERLQPADDLCREQGTWPSARMS